MKKIKSFINEHKKIILIEVAILVIYGFIAFFVVSDNKKYLAIFFSSEVLVSLLIATGAVYSWIYYKSISDSEIADREYERDLKLLDNIDKLLGSYEKNGDIDDILKQTEIPNFIIHTLKNKYEKQNTPEQEFLSLYYEYLRDKVSAENKQDKQLSNQKTKISEKQDIDRTYIRWSKNSSLEKDEWSTFYTLPVKLFDTDTEFILYTRTNSGYEGLRISTKSLKEYIIKQRSLNGNLVCDFYLKMQGEVLYINEKVVDNRSYKTVDLDYLKSS